CQPREQGKNMLGIASDLGLVIAAIAAHGEVFFDGELAKDAPSFGHHDQAAPYQHIGWGAGNRFAVVKNIAAGQGYQAAMARSVVLLPAPFAPIKLTSSPRPTCKSMPRTARMPPYATSNWRISSRFSVELILY